MGATIINGALFCIAGLHNTLYTLAATTYPTTARATGVGTASAVGRLGAVLSSFTGVLSLDFGGSAAFLAASRRCLHCAASAACAFAHESGFISDPVLIGLISRSLPSSGGRVGYTAANNRFNIAQAEVTGGVRADEV